MMIPKDPVMLLSFVNMKLRDFYKDLDSLCEELEMEKETLVEKLASVGYYYNGETNQFV